MAIRSNHYDLAFEQYLRMLRVPYVAVDEQRRTLLQSRSLKSFDFIVHPPQGPTLLVDVKGRKFLAQDGSRRWENWATAEDIPALLEWEQVFGGQTQAALVFAYSLTCDDRRPEFDELFTFRNQTYAFCAILARDYEQTMRPRSASWQTVSLPRRSFRDLAAPFHNWLRPGAQIAPRFDSRGGAPGMHPADLAAPVRAAATGPSTTFPADST